MMSNVKIQYDFFDSGKSAVAVSLLCAFLAGCAEEQAPVEAAAARPVKTITLTEGGGPIKRQFPGTVRAAKRVDLSFQVAGKLLELPVWESQVISEGELIAKLDDRDYVSNLKSAQAESNDAAANFKRAAILIKDGNISKTDHDRLRSKKEVAAANLAKARKAVDDTQLHAPFSGRVATRFVENFTDVQAKEPIISLQDIEQLEILVDVPEKQAIRSKPGVRPAKLNAMFASVPGREFPLEVKEFSTEADPNTQTFQAVLSMPQPEGLSILPGMTATVLVVESAKTAESDKQAGFVIPAVALVADSAGASQVWVVDSKDNTVHKRAVKTGALTGSDQILIVSGLKADEMVAVSGVSRLREGMEIRPVDKVEF